MAESLLYPVPIRAVIFDNDGTLVDSEGAYSIVHRVCTGQPLDLGLKVTMMGKKYLEACQLTVDFCHLDETAEEYGVRFAKEAERHWPTIDLMPGVMRMLETLSAKGVRMCIATGSSEKSFRQKVSGHPEMIAFMDHCVTGDDVSKGKPEPDLFILAMEKWKGIKAEEILVFEDSPLGVDAAHRAGMPVVFVPDQEMAKKGLFDSVADLPVCTITSLEEFEYDRFLWAGQ
jgi:pseudouridine-5'-monophosphatase